MNVVIVGDGARSDWALRIAERLTRWLSERPALV
jgi:hypothetical protein